MAKYNQTAHKILDIAERFTQTRGFNAFSYRDIQQEMGIKTSSIHYYFPVKQDLAAAMVTRYSERYQDDLEGIDTQDISATEKLRKLGNIFISATKAGKFCLCGMMAADLMAIPPEAEDALTAFFDLNEQWIACVIAQGISSGELKQSVQPNRAACHFLATLEGGMLIARVRRDARYLQTMIEESLDEMRV
ncbi:MAG: TetR/AcrR family transcriptional regulator [Chloroflexota bacterium]